jgi:flavin reductase (DIM6/NTAB) family NADH-FMN oxidoreductase RutF
VNAEGPAGGMSSAKWPVDLDVVSEIFDQLDRLLWVVTAQAGDRRGGLIATFVSRPSIVPAMPRMLVGLGHRHFTTELIKASGRFVLHLFGEEQMDWVWRFGLNSGRNEDKFQGLTVTARPSGCPILADAQAWLECRVETSLDTGDRTLFLGEVIVSQLLQYGSPLTMKRLVQLAPPEKLLALKEDLLRDAALDAEAIQTWRARQSIK